MATVKKSNAKCVKCWTSFDRAGLADDYAAEAQKVIADSGAKFDKVTLFLVLRIRLALAGVCPLCIDREAEKA